mmetsp:Transcript_63629/g.127615  ORF Transcript_63629/g.127615 Transcript_63629/m.127615 type:complete len:248 (-) Transcript_63629:291-1034(-)
MEDAMQQRGPLCSVHLLQIPRAGLALHAVSGEEKLREEDEVRGVHPERRCQVRDVAVAFGHSPPHEDVDVEESDHDAAGHLGKLQDRHEQSPLRGPLAHRREEVVEVHDRVHGVVHCDEVDPGRHLPHERMPTVQQDGAMVVPMKEPHLPLASDEEGCVKQLEVLGQDEEKHPQPGRAVSVAGAGGAAQRVAEAELPQEHEEVWDGAQHADDREDRQQQVPDRQGHLQVERFPVPHVGRANPQADQI